MTSTLADIAGWALLLSSLLAFGGRLGFPIELFGHWRMQIAVVAAVAIAGAIALSHAFLFGCAVSAIVNTVPVLWMARAAARRSTRIDGPALTLVWQNAGLKRAAVERLADLVRERDADLVAICEPPLDLTDAALAEILPDHPYLARCEPDDPQTYDARILIASRLPIVALSTHEDHDFVRRPYAVLRLEDVELPLAFVHAASSAWPGGLKKRDAAIEHFTRRMAGEPRWAALGDFNTTAWVPAFEVLRSYRLAPPFFRRTWRALPPVYGLPLDHVLASPGVVAELSYGPWNGSDHRSVVLRLSA